MHNGKVNAERPAMKAGGAQGAPTASGVERRVVRSSGTGRDDPPAAVVIGLDCITGLQTARILHRRGVPVIGIAKDPSHYCCRTRVCRQMLTVQNGSVDFNSRDDLVQVLSELGATLPQRAVLFPCSDMHVLTVSRNRDVLSQWYHIALPPHDVVEMLMDKLSFYAFAERAGLPVPRTVLLKSRLEAEQAAETFSFPCIVKPPVKTARWEANTKIKAFRVESGDELLALYDRCADWAEVLVLQEWIEGGEANLYSCNCYFNSDSQPLVTFIARKLRQWPPGTGTSCLGEECRNDVVLEESLRLFQSVGYWGLGYVEMKRDEHTGRHVIIEPNIGRPTGRSAIAEAGGVELLYTMYCDLVGRPLPENRRQQYRGVKWIYWRRDIQSALYYWRRGELTLREWWKSVRGRKGCAVFSWTDAGPFCADLRNALRATLFGRRGAAEEITIPARAAASGLNAEEAVLSVK